MPMVLGFPENTKKAATIPSTAPEMMKYRVVIVVPLFCVNQPDFLDEIIAEFVFIMSLFKKKFDFT